jgi:malate dehydrogenase (oxaloacetate-decarboxylating)(NADP+)
VTHDRGDKLADHKVYFSRHDNDAQYKTLTEVIEYVKPTILMGLSTIGGVFDSNILTRMTEFNDRPIIFPLSNPSANSECTFENAITHTHGRALFASGSPFPDFEYHGINYTACQGNNMYVFPGIGLGAILCKAVNVTQDMIYASAEALSTSLTAEETDRGLLYPEIGRIRDVSVVVARGVIRAAQKGGVDRELSLRDISNPELDAYIKQHMYDPWLHGKLVEEEYAALAAGQNAERNGGPHL